jgi:hypothetical protein
MTIEEPDHDVERLFGFGYISIIEETMEESVPCVQFRIDSRFGEPDIRIESPAHGEIACRSNQQRW